MSSNLKVQDGHSDTTTGQSAHEALRRAVNERKSLYEEAGRDRLALALDTIWSSGKSKDILYAALLQNPTSGR
jgi:hypothetical protein